MVGLEAWILALLGATREADRPADELRGTRARPMTRSPGMLWRAAKGVVLARRGDAAEADPSARKAVAIADADGFRWMPRPPGSLGRMVLSILGRREELMEGGPSSP